MESCRDEILAGVTKFEKLGYPGRIIVFGINAEPILTGPDEKEVILAASQLGKGRMFLFSHCGYGKQFADVEGSYENSTLYSNIRNWVTNKKLCNDIKILNLDDCEPFLTMEELQKYDIVLFFGDQESVSCELLEEYIRQGGAFVYAKTFWGWLQLNPEKTLNELPYANILRKGGLAASQEAAEDLGSGFALSSNRAHKAHQRYNLSDESDSMESCRDEILVGVTKFEKLGYPGRIIVFGINAEPILTGPDEKEVILAASQLGKGRMFLFSQCGYGKQFADVEGSYENSTLYSNIRNWVTNKKLCNDIKILNLDDCEPFLTMEELQKYDIVLFFGGQESVSCESLEEYIRQGGAFVYAKTFWGWLDLNPEKTLNELPYANILIKGGLAASQGVAEDLGSGFALSSNRAHKAHLQRCLASCSEDLDMLINNIGLISRIGKLPIEVAELFKPAIEKQWKKVESKIGEFCQFEGIKTKNINQKKMLDFWLLGADLQEKKTFKAPKIKHFPGDFDQLPQFSVEKVQFSSVTEEYYFTACYAVAAVPITVEVEVVNNTWVVLVGAHMDCLKNDEVNRWPKVCLKTNITKPGTYNISSPFGGGVYFVSSLQGQGSIVATISNIVASPRFDLLDSSRLWKESKNNPGLWADLSGKYVTITVPSSSIKTLDDPTDVMKLYDELLIAYHDLRGTDISQERKMWIVADIQPSAGYMHSGYPIVTHLDITDPMNECFLLSAENFKNGKFWGLFHEMGHNMQQDDWTFDGTTEVTVNIFTLYGMQVICGIKPWIHPWLKDSFQAALKYLDSGADLNSWDKKPEIALFFYVQLINIFTFATYKKVFRCYQNLNNSKKPKLNQDKIDLWFVIFSEESKHNLIPFAAFWGIPLSDSAITAISCLDFMEFLPDDDLTRMVPDRVEKIRSEFPNIYRISRP